MICDDIISKKLYYCCIISNGINRSSTNFDIMNSIMNNINYEYRI